MHAGMKRKVLRHVVLMMLIQRTHDAETSADPERTIAAAVSVLSFIHRCCHAPRNWLFAFTLWVLQCLLELLLQVVQVINGGRGCTGLSNGLLNVINLRFHHRAGDLARSIALMPVA